MSGKAKRLGSRLLAIVLVLFVAGGALYALLAREGEQAEAEPTAAIDDVMHLGEVQAAVDKQQAVDAELLQILQSGEYTLEDPYVQLDPYGESPLTAIAVFTTNTPCRISVHVEGDTPKADVDFTFDAYETEHAVPVLGLYADRANAVTLTATAQDGTETETVLEITTEALPDFFDGFNLITETLDESAYAEGLNFPSQCQSYINYPFAFDSNGAVRWVLTNYTSDMEYFFFRDTAEGFIIGRGYAYGDTAFSVVNVLGKVLDVYYSPYGSHHGLYQTDHDSWIVTGSDPYSEATKEDVLYELSTADGSIVNVLDFKTVLEKTRVYGAEDHSGSYDWLHLNAVAEYQDDVIVSSNYQSLVMRVGWDGQIQWMLADPTGYLEMYDQYMLTPVGDDFEWPYNQHAIELLPDQDGNDDTVDILLFDNGTSRSLVNDTVNENYSRLVQYRIDEKNMTVKQIWAYGEDRTELYSAWCGDADLLDNGNILGTFCISQSIPDSSEHGVYLEVNRAGELVWECLAQSVLEDNLYASYRCTRLNIYTENILDLHLGEEPAVLVPDTVWAKYGITPVTTTPADSAGTAEASASVTAAAEPTETPAATNVPETSAAADDTTASTAPVWDVAVESAALLPALHTETEVQQYEGDYKTIVYDNAPSDGMQFALLNLTVTKTQKTKSSFDWANLTLVLADGSAYARAADTYLSDHGYARISGTKLSLSTASGYACFEVPADATLDGAVLRYTADGAAAMFALP